MLVRHFYDMTYKHVNSHQMRTRSCTEPCFWVVLQEYICTLLEQAFLKAAKVFMAKGDLELNIYFQFYPSVFFNKGYYIVNIQVHCHVNQIKGFQLASPQSKPQNSVFHFVVTWQTHAIL